MISTDVVTEKPEIKERITFSLKDMLMMKLFLKRMRNRKLRLLRENKKEAVKLAKESILQCIEFMCIEDEFINKDGKKESREVTKEDVIAMSDEKSIECFDTVVKLLEETYTARA